jgi:hypothetical protein
MSSHTEERQYDIKTKKKKKKVKEGKELTTKEFVPKTKRLVRAVQLDLRLERKSSHRGRSGCGDHQLYPRGHIFRYTPLLTGRYTGYAFI